MPELKFTSANPQDDFHGNWPRIQGDQANAKASVGWG